MSEYKSTRDVIVRAAHLGAAKEFYEKVLRLPTAYAGDKLMGYETGAFRLYVEEGAAHGPVFEFHVENLAQAKAELLAAGCTLVEENPAIPRCYLRDPFGLVFNLEERKR